MNIQYFRELLLYTFIKSTGQTCISFFKTNNPSNSTKYEFGNRPANENNIKICFKTTNTNSTQHIISLCFTKGNKNIMPVTVRLEVNFRIKFNLLFTQLKTPNQLLDSVSSYVFVINVFHLWLVAVLSF